MASLNFNLLDFIYAKPDTQLIKSNESLLNTEKWRNIFLAFFTQYLRFKAPIVGCRKWGL